MIYNFIKYGEEYPLFEMKDCGPNISKGNFIVLNNKRYKIEYIETIVSHPEDGWYLCVETKRINVYIKEQL